MSRTRRNFSAKFKSELVIELLKGEKDLNMNIPLRRSRLSGKMETTCPDRRKPL